MRFKSLMLSLTLVGAMAMPLVYAAPAQAQASRTWVSGFGDDANPCSRTAPCKTFAGAITKTAAGGEIDVIDPGGFGSVTITKSITIDGGGGLVASILAGTNANGIVVNAGATDVVVIKNIRFQGVLGNGGGSSALNAIRFVAGLKLVVENCEIYGWGGSGIDIANTTAGNFTAITNTQIMNVNGGGVFVESAGTSQVDISEARIYAANFGVSTVANNTVVVSRSVISKAGTQAVHADANGTVALNDNVISFSNIGIGGGGTVKSYNNNNFFGNTTDGSTSLIGSTTNPTGMQ